MMSIHIGAPSGAIAKRVLLPGDPLRAKHIAETFFEDAKLYNEIRGALGYTGTYKGVRVSVQGTGMGIPSIAIYVNELIKDYGARKLIRVGTCGAMHENINIRDIVIAQGTSTDSSIVRNIFGPTINFAPLADFSLLTKAVECAKKLNISAKVGNIITVDRFYDDDIDNDRLRRYGILAVEMEAAALYILAAQYRVQSLGIFTASDHLLTKEVVPAEERQTDFNDMVEIALETIIQD
ncbi:purine-nucleoside phosphorylase [Anaerovibrio sp.]|uniref:purine-nucleoside phosphorylase n=1 Tax=Anaerovibrio sp. TaxID=1872532 RepID=UPI0025B93E67|nr:purine-nucleoside phosphorylase [Anaerovibrio sp.]MBR2142193.1 purine-nucleoside phosphorylase [Anaerovibrio sp.]